MRSARCRTTNDVPCWARTCRRTPPPRLDAPWPPTSTRRCTTSSPAVPRRWSSVRTSAARVACTTSPPASSSGSGWTGCSTPCSTRPPSSASRRVRRCWASCRSPRSSTWPTSTTRWTRSAARRLRCRSSPPASTPTRWWSASRDWLTRRASAATSTTTTPSGRSATSRGWRSPARAAATRPPGCCGPRWPWRPSTAGSWRSSNPSRCTTRKTCTSRATAGGCSTTPRRARSPCCRATSGSTTRRARPSRRC